jgi:SAM-dependent methyltransferase
MANDWSEFYTAQAGRGVRATFVAGLDARGELPPGRAIDLGCGDGVETRELLERGWRVLAIDSDETVEERVRATIGDTADSAPVEIWKRPFEALTGLPEADFVYAGFALPFCDASHFPYLWADIREALQVDGVFAGEFFGPDDDWFGRPGMNFHDSAGVQRMLADLEIIQVVEDNRDGLSFEGPKHWHVFHVVARNPG